MISQGAEMLLRDFYERYYEPLALRARSDKTRRQYEMSLRMFEAFLERPAEVSDLTDETVSRFLGWYRKLGGGRSAASANQKRSHLLCLWRWACRKKVLVAMPDVPSDPEPRRVPRAWSKDELARLFAACRRQEGTVGGVPAAGWWTALHYVAWDTGERIEALMALSWSCIDWGSRWLVVPAELRKGRQEPRAYLLSEKTMKTLSDIIEPYRELIWPWPHHPNSLWRAYGKVLRDAGLPDDRWGKFHALRRSVASHAEAAGVDATKLLGHSSRRITEAYLDPRIVGQVSACDCLFAPEGPATEPPR